MAISRVGSASAAATSVTLPTHQADDVILIYAYRSGSNTAPSLPSGWTNIGNSGTGSSSFRWGWLRATGSGTTSGTWTNATHVHAIIYRGALVSGTPVGTM